MREFKSGQLVAVRDGDGCAWSLRAYGHKRGGQHFCREPEKARSQAVWWAQVCPAEEVWPELFFRRDCEDMNHMRRMRQDIGAKRRQIEWLCDRLQAIGDRNGTQNCPLREHVDCLPGLCAQCWEAFSVKAAKEAGFGPED